MPQILRKMHAMLAVAHAAFAAVKSTAVCTMGTMGKSTHSVLNVKIAFMCFCLVCVGAYKAQPPLVSACINHTRGGVWRCSPLLPCDANQVPGFSCTAGFSYLCPLASEAGEHQQVLPTLSHMHRAELFATATALRRDGEASRHHVQALRRGCMQGPPLSF